MWTCPGAKPPCSRRDGDGLDALAGDGKERLDGPGGVAEVRVWAMNAFPCNGARLDLHRDVVGGFGRGDEPAIALGIDPSRVSRRLALLSQLSEPHAGGGALAACWT